jgi:ribonuclease HI
MKNTASNVETNTLFAEYVANNHHDCEVIYTDGSKTEERVGAAFVHRTTKEKFKLPSNTSNFTAEIIAMVQATHYLASKSQRRFVIATDSLSTIRRLQSSNSNNHDQICLIELRRQLKTLQDSGFYVTILWVPAHKGLRGNEEADKLAKEGALDGTTIHSNVERSCISSWIKGNISDEWQKQWNNHENGRYTFSLFPKVLNKPWFQKLNLPRSVIVTTTRLMLNHHALNSHLNRFDIISSGLCDCNQNYQTVDHILWDCSLRIQGRNELISEINKLDLFTGDVRFLIAPGNISKDCLTRIHNFLRRHKLHL